jgi:hypothetical protein
MHTKSQTEAAAMHVKPALEEEKVFSKSIEALGSIEARLRLY